MKVLHIISSTTLTYHTIIPLLEYLKNNKVDKLDFAGIDNITPNAFMALFVWNNNCRLPECFDSDDEYRNKLLQELNKPRFINNLNTNIKEKISEWIKGNDVELGYNEIELFNKLLSLTDYKMKGKIYSYRPVIGLEEIYEENGTYYLVERITKKKDKIRISPHSCLIISDYQIDNKLLEERDRKTIESWLRYSY